MAMNVKAAMGIYSRHLKYSEMMADTDKGDRLIEAAKADGRKIGITKEGKAVLYSNVLVRLLNYSDCQRGKKFIKAIEEKKKDREITSKLVENELKQAQCRPSQNGNTATSDNNLRGVGTRLPVKIQDSITRDSESRLTGNASSDTRTSSRPTRQPPPPPLNREVFRTPAALPRTFINGVHVDGKSSPPIPPTRTSSLSGNSGIKEASKPPVPFPGTRSFNKGQ